MLFLMGDELVEMQPMTKQQRGKQKKGDASEVTPFQKRCWAIGISMQLQKEPNVGDMLRGAEMIETFVNGGGAPANVTALVERRIADVQ